MLYFSNYSSLVSMIRIIGKPGAARESFYSIRAAYFFFAMLALESTMNFSQSPKILNVTPNREDSFQSVPYSSFGSASPAAFGSGL